MAPTRKPILKAEKERHVDPYPIGIGQHGALQALPFKSANFKDTDLRAGCCFALMCLEGEVASATPLVKDKCDTRSYPANSADRGLITLAASYLNGETRREAREGAVHPKMASPPVSHRSAGTATSHAQLITMAPPGGTAVRLIPSF